MSKSKFFSLRESIQDSADTATWYAVHKLVNKLIRGSVVGISPEIADFLDYGVFMHVFEQIEIGIAIPLRDNIKKYRCDL